MPTAAEPSEAITVAGLHHVGLLVDDLDAALEFYSGLLGLRVRPDRPDFGVPGVWLDIGDDQQLHLFAGGTPPDGGQHVALGVADLDRALELLHQRGMRFRAFPKGGPFDQAVIHDPCGNRVELYLV